MMTVTSLCPYGMLSTVSAATSAPWQSPRELKEDAANGLKERNEIEAFLSNPCATKGRACLFL